MLAYRVWRVVVVGGEALRLGSLGTLDLWEKEMVAYCLAPGTVADHLRAELPKARSRHKCGLYAVKGARDVIDTAREVYAGIPGSVTLYGTVLETELGYRATNARVEILYKYMWRCSRCGGGYRRGWVEADRMAYWGFPLNTTGFLCAKCVTLVSKPSLVFAKKDVYGLLSNYYRVPWKM